MKKALVFSALALATSSLLAADAKDDVTAAAKKLADQANYTWKTTVDMGPNAQFTPGPTEGKTADGYVWLSMSFNDNTTEAVKKGDKVAVKTEEGWQAGSDLTGGGGGGGFNPGMMMARRVQTMKAPAEEIADLVSKAKSISKDGDAYSGDLTEDGIKALSTMGFGGRRGGGGQAPQITDGKGTVKFWVKDGAVTKYQFKVSGKRPSREGDMMEFERTTTVELKDAGTTKLDVPEDAKKKLS